MTNLITAAMSESETTMRASVCSIILLCDKINVGSTKSCFNLRNVHAALVMWCLLQSRYCMSLDALQEARAGLKKQPTAAGNAGLGSSLVV